MVTIVRDIKLSQEFLTAFLNKLFFILSDLHNTLSVLETRAHFLHTYFGFLISETSIVMSFSISQRSQSQSELFLLILLSAPGLQN